MNQHAASFGCNTYSYTQDGPVDACLSRLADLGFVAFEPMVYPGHLWPPSPSAEQLPGLRRAMTSRGLQIATLNMPNIDINIAAAAPEMRSYSLNALEGVIQLAGELAAPGVVVGPGKPNPLFPADRKQLLGHFFAALDRLCPTAEAAGTALWVENMPFTFLPGIDGLVDALDRYGNDAIGIVYDVANAHFIGEDIAFGLERSGDRLRLVHLSDTGQGIYRHDPVGRGTVPFDTLPSALTAVGYNKRTMLEIISRDPDHEIIESVNRLADVGFGPPSVPVDEPSVCANGS